MDKFVKITSMSTGDKENEVDSEMESEIQHTTKRKRETSVVWQVFKKCKETNMAVCKQCGKQYKTGGNTTNLMDHLKQRDILYSNNSEKKKRIDKLVLNMVASDVLPLNVVSNDGLTKLIHELDPRYKMLSKTHLRNVLLKNECNT
ncbi:uncharacterized protein LOC117134678 isoform X3 [Drosophila busckii]|uniref:uncharacterized protein LOC117134678 isoform X3 n=1 Tax=Drosophila busckii TaxID=30019 RepID=UPI001433172A|nr:uncharacterized protein LOC117134678 isoform X3 [Drosophila busckii]